MFGFEQWDSPVSLGIEVGMSLLIVIGLLFIVRRVNANAEAERRRSLDADKQAQSEIDRNQHDQQDRRDNE
ncbi:MAG: hypothetical protein ABJA50_02080 [Chloroflexota bacterium]